MLNQKNEVQNVIDSATKSTENIIDVKKIIGDKIVNDRGQTAIPLSKVTVGVFSGGGNYGDLKLTKEVGERFAGGAVTITSIKPECFLIDNGTGFEVINSNGIFDVLVSSLTQIIKKIKE